MAEEFAGGQFPRKTAAVHRDERCGAARTVFVDQVCSVFLARSAFADDEHRHVRRRHDAYVFVELFRCGTLSEDDVAGGLFRPLFLFLRHRHPRGGQRGILHGLFDLLLQYGRVDGFLKVVEGAQFDGRYRALYLGVAGHDDHLYVGSFVLDPRQQHDSVAVGQPQVGECDAEVLLQNLLFRLFHGQTVGGGVTVLFGPVRYGQPVCSIVFYDQYFVHR